MRKVGHYSPLTNCFIGCTIVFESYHTAASHIRLTLVVAHAITWNPDIVSQKALFSDSLQAHQAWPFS